MFEYKTVMKETRFGEILPQEVPVWKDNQTLNTNGTAFKGINIVNVAALALFVGFIGLALIG